ncbi:hypothetical protein, partial [Frankia sp. Cr2]|uniref:hypothetical protein n=1 Tax=Frankia sp. Cr2 TaxID=3073932 RepID=UPI002AD416AA
MEENDDDVSTVADATVDLRRCAHQSLIQPGQEVIQASLGRMRFPHARHLNHNPIFDHAELGHGRRRAGMNQKADKASPAKGRAIMLL